MMSGWRGYTGGCECKSKDVRARIAQLEAKLAFTEERPQKFFYAFTN